MAKDIFTRTWIKENSTEILSRYEPGILTLRGLYYQLVALGMTNSISHYKRVVNAMIEARWDKSVDFEAFSDRDREMTGFTNASESDLESSILQGKSQIKAWMSHYSKNKWENQPIYPEVFIEKKALQGVFESVCWKNDIALGACKGYPSLTFLYDATRRFIEAEKRGKNVIVLYFGDYDPSGEDIPRAIEENIKRLGCETIEVKRIALMHHQVIDWNLPPAPIKSTDSRAAKWNGIGQVELDAVEPRKLQRMCQDAISSVFDESLFNKLKKIEEKERVLYTKELRSFVNEL